MLTHGFWVKLIPPSILEGDFSLILSSPSEWFSGEHMHRPDSMRVNSRLSLKPLGKRNSFFPLTYALAFTNCYIHVLDFYVRPSLCALETVYSCLLKSVPPLQSFSISSAYFLNHLFSTLAQLLANSSQIYFQRTSKMQPLLARTMTSTLVPVPSSLI